MRVFANWIWKSEIRVQITTRSLPRCKLYPKIVRGDNANNLHFQRNIEGLEKHQITAETMRMFAKITLITARTRGLVERDDAQSRNRMGENS